MNDTINYTQGMFNEDLTSLVEQIQSSGQQYSLIVGLARGGLIPAVALSHRLNVPMEPLQWQTRSGGEKERKRSIITSLHKGERILIVDDLIDSGRAMKELLEDWGADQSKVDIAVLYYNPSQDIKPNFYNRIIDRSQDERWIVFWWEQ